jgi:hypothetical protein
MSISAVQTLMKSYIYQNCLTNRAYGLQSTFSARLEYLMDQHQKAFFPSTVSSRWLTIQVETIGNLIIFCVALLIVLGNFNTRSDC